MATYLTAGSAADVAIILHALNDLDATLEDRQEKVPGNSAYGAAQLGLGIDIVDRNGDTIGRVENEIGPGCWAFVDSEG